MKSFAIYHHKRILHETIFWFKIKASISLANIQHARNENKRNILLFKSHQIFIMKFHLRTMCVCEHCNHVSVYIPVYIRKDESNLVSDDNKSKSSQEGKLSTTRSFLNKNRIYYDFRLLLNRFLYWRVCCYVCTREPKKKKRQIMRRETYRQQQQLALQDRPA